MDRTPAPLRHEEPSRRRERVAERAASLRVYAVAGTVAALGVFTALAATNRTLQPDAPATSPIPAADNAPGEVDDIWDRAFGSDQRFFAPAPSGSLGPGSGSSGPPTVSGGS